MIKPTFRIDIIDDDPDYVMLLQQFLQRLGYSQVAPCNESTGYYIQAGKNPQIVFVDYHMPGLNGLELLKKIKRLHPETRVVLLSGQTDMDVAMTALKCGAYDYIVKNPAQFGRIEEVLSKAYREFEEGQCTGFAIDNLWLKKRSADSIVDNYL